VVGAYRPLFADRAARPLVAASLTGRRSIGIFDLPLIVAVEQVSGSYAVAGAAVGAHAAGLAVSAPARGRLLDRRGTRSALPALVAAQTLSLAALPLLAWTGAAWTLVAASALAGLTSPAFAAAVRLGWQRLLAGRPVLLARAYAFETSAQITVFIAGALVAARATPP
jgi:MFS family permease